MKFDGILHRISDSNRERPSEPARRSGEDSPAVFYGIAIAAGAAASALTFTQSGISLLLLLAVAIAALVLLRMWTVGIVLLIIQGALLFGQPQALMVRVSPFDLILAAGVMTLLLAACRYFVIAPELSPVADLSDSTIRYLPERFRESLAGQLSRRARRFSVAERSTGLLRIVLAVAGAAFLLRSVPVNPYALDEARLIPSGLRLISLGVLLLSIFLVTDLLLDTMTWRRISLREARLFLRSVLTSWCDRELRAVNRHDAKQRRKRR